jgi:hypothetical protein
MIEWFNPKIKLPNDGQECLLIPLFTGQICTIPVYGPIMWSSKNNLWIDILRNPNTGECISPDQIDLWTDWVILSPYNEKNKTINPPLNEDEINTGNIITNEPMISQNVEIKGPLKKLVNRIKEAL